jgi:hypothetical protein
MPVANRAIMQYTRLMSASADIIIATSIVATTSTTARSNHLYACIPVLGAPNILRYCDRSISYI